MILLIYLLVKDRVEMEKQQKLYELLKKQHEAEKNEIIHYSSLLKEIDHNLIRNYINTLLNDGIKHIQYHNSGYGENRRSFRKYSSN